MQCFVQKQSFERTSIITKRGRIITKRGDLITEIIFTPLCGYNYTCSELSLEWNGEIAIWDPGSRVR